MYIKKHFCRKTSSKSQIAHTHLSDAGLHHGGDAAGHAVHESAGLAARAGPQGVHQRGQGVRLGGGARRLLALGDVGQHLQGLGEVSLGEGGTVFRVWQMAGKLIKVEHNSFLKGSN